MASNVERAAEPVVWSLAMERAEARADGWFTGRLKAEIADGYHMYSVTQPPGGPNPTTIAPAPGQPFTVANVRPWPEPERVFDSKFGMETEYHVGSVLFDVSMKPAPDASLGEHELVLSVGYQLCDEHTCLRPEIKELRTAIRITPGEKNAAAANSPSAASATASPVQPSSEKRFRQLREVDKSEDEIEAGIRQILADDPKWALGYMLLAKKPAARGDFRGQRAVLRKGLAAKADPIALHFALSGCASGDAARRRQTQDFVRRFPKSTHSVFALTALANLSGNRSERLKYLERAVRVPGNVVFVLRELCPLLAETHPEKAASLAEKVKKSLPADSQLWAVDTASALASFYCAVSEIHRLLREGKTSAALKAAQKLEAPVVPHMGVSAADVVVQRLTKTRALVSAGRAQQAYDELIAEPSFVEHEQLIDTACQVGRELGKSRRLVEDEGWQRVLQAEHPAAEFEVPAARGASMTARNFSGKVLLVNTWNPG